MTREELIAKLEGLSGADRATDAEIARFVSGVSSKFDLVIATPYTSSVDAVLALIQERLPGHEWQISFNPTATALPFIGTIWRPPVAPDASITDGRSWSKHVPAGGKSPALALLAATLRALTPREAGAE